MVKFGGRWFFKRKNYWNENKSFEDFFGGDTERIRRNEHPLYSV